MFNANKKVKRTRNGFTLIELLVSMAMFAIVMTVVIQIFVTGMGSTRYLFAREAALDSARFIMESMSKEIRMSTINTPGGGPYNTLNITNPKIARTLNYFFDSTGKDIQRDGGVLNPNDVEITGSFYVMVPSNYSPSRVTIVMKIRSKSGGSSQMAEINLQTTVSSREYR